MKSTKTDIWYDFCIRETDYLPEDEYFPNHFVNIILLFATYIIQLSNVFKYFLKNYNLCEKV